MPKINGRFLDTGDTFPRLELNQAGGGKITLPDELQGHWGVILFYRGHW